MFSTTPGTILWLFIFGDQHHKTSAAAREGRKVISDGGSNIHTNLILRLPRSENIKIFTYQDNYQVRNFFGQCPNIIIQEFRTISGFFQTYLLWLEVLTRCLYPGLTFLFRKIDSHFVVTQTDFLPDTWAAFLIKLRHPRVVWIASFFLAAPAPWQKDSPYRGKRRLIGFCYWLLQIPSVWFIRWQADKIIFTSEPDVQRFVNKKRDRSKLIVVQGGVNIEPSEKYLHSGHVIPLKVRKYDACFVGRFHNQKGVLELIDIWKEVCREKSEAKLAMVGNGPLEKEVRKKVAQHQLAQNVDLLGFMGAEDKYDVFKQSQIIVHPATYDSGGMAAAEGMAWGLPGVSFDLASLKTYYPKGMLKVPLGDQQGFARAILRLLQTPDLYQELSTEAHQLIVDVWDWDKRAARIYQELFGTNNFRQTS